MESCPKCGSPPQYAEKSPSGVNYFKCWSYTIGAEFEQSFSCSRITALAEENEYLKEEVTILESEVVHRDARIAELSPAKGEHAKRARWAISGDYEIPQVSSEEDSRDETW